MANRGFGRVMNLSEDRARAVYSEKVSERESKVNKLIEKYSHSKGLALGKGKLEEMYEKNPTKASNLVLFLEATEKLAYNDPILLQNAQKEATRKALSETREFKEAMQTGGSAQLMLPSDIVKVARIGYTNSIAQDVFDVWGMTSMKDSLYKLETTYGSTARGATAGEVTYETYGEGRYPTTFEKATLTDGGAHTTYTATLTIVPIIPFKVSVFADNVQVAVDNGNGGIVGSGVSGTINYTTGAISVTFTTALEADAVVTVQYAYDFENEQLFSQTGSVLLNLVEYTFSATLKPLAIEWTRFSQDVLESKLGLSGKDMLIAGGGDEFRKAFDEQCVAKGIIASNWTEGIEFNTDFATSGSDSSMEHAQSVLNAIVDAENLTYDKLGRLADTTNIVCDSKSYSYLTKHRRFVSVTPTSKVGIFKVGEIDGRGIYMTPKTIINPKTNEGMLYLFGKSVTGQNVDAPVSVGTYGTGISTNPIELKNFNSQMGLGVYSDMRINNQYFATKVTLKNLTSNS